MHRFAWCILGTICLALFNTSTVLAQNLRLRGTIESVSGQTLTIKTQDGSYTNLVIADNARVLEIVSSSLENIKSGSYVGVIAIPQPDGSQRAVEVNVFPEAMRGTGEGSRPWDFAPSSTMTNATVETEVASISGEVLTLKYKDGEKKITVPANTPIVTYSISDVSQLKPGMKITILDATKQPDGTLLAHNVEFGKNSAPPSKVVSCEITSAGIVCSAPTDAQGAERLADDLSRKLREMPSKYNKPGTLFFGEISSCAVCYSNDEPINRRNV